MAEQFRDITALRAFVKAREEAKVAAVIKTPSPSYLLPKPNKKPTLDNLANTSGHLKYEAQEALSPLMDAIGLLAPVSIGAQLASYSPEAEAARRVSIPATNYMRNLKPEVEKLYRETSGESFLDLFNGNFPFGAPRQHYAEIPEMALGQGTNKGLRFEISPTDAMLGKINLAKPGLDQAYLNGAGEFILESQPSDIVKAITGVTVTPQAYEGLSKGLARRLDNLLEQLTKQGIDVMKEVTK